MMTWLAGVPALALSGAYLWLAYDHGTPWMLDVTVHENGHYTLGETILYFRHFLRELPVALVYATATTSAAATWGPRCTTAPSRALRARVLVGAALLVTIAWTLTARTWGSGVAWHEMLQAYLHDDDPPVPGVHWRYHLLSTIAYMAAAVTLATLLQRLLDGAFRMPAAHRRGFPAVVAATIGVTLACGLTTAPFVDARTLGHQAREVATHLVIALPLSFAILLAVGRWRADPAARTGTRPALGVVVAALVAGAAIAYCAIGTVARGAMATVGPHAALSSLVAAHCYEHILDDLLIVLVSLGLAPRLAAREAVGCP